MSTDPQNYLRVIDDAFTPVRDASGRLLGCVPRVADDAVTLAGRELRIAMQICVYVNIGAGESPIGLPGFVPIDDADTDLAVPIGDTQEP